MCNAHTINNKVPDGGIGVWQTDNVRDYYRNWFKDFQSDISETQLRIVFQINGRIFI